MSQNKKQISFDSEQEENIRDIARRILGLKRNLTDFFRDTEIEAGTGSNPSFKNFSSRENSGIFIVSPLKEIDVRYFKDSLERSGAKILNVTKYPSKEEKYIFEVEPSGIQDGFLL